MQQLTDKRQGLKISYIMTSFDGKSYGTAREQVYIKLRALARALAEFLRVTCERELEPRRVFARELLACTRLLHECEILASVCPCTYVTRT